MDPLDKLLAELKAEYEEPAKQKQPQIDPPIAPLLSQPPSNMAHSPHVPLSNSLMDSLLAEVKADFEQRDVAAELQRQEHLRQEQIKHQQLKVKQLEALKKQAQDWLEKLDSFSPEGLWFERFAEKYSSKLEAAMDYLQDVD